MRTAENRLVWKLEREAYVGKIIRASGDLKGALIIRHIDGSLYQATLDGETTFVSGVKSKKNKAFISDNKIEWKLWEDAR